MKRWVFSSSELLNVSEELKKTYPIKEAVLKILLNRGFDSEKKIREFTEMRISDLHDPFLMSDMERSVDRIVEGVERGEKMMVYGDYDVDGTTSVAMMYSFVLSLGGDVEYYIPDRYSEGYGISISGIDYCIEKEITLIIALDCGTKDFASIAHARVNGIDVIVCDHHEAGKELPEVYSILNPKKSNCKYPFKELSGCGVGFKLMQGICKKKSLPISLAFYYLDLVAISIACDIVPIVGENRILAHYGLRKLMESPFPGLVELLSLTNKSRSKITVSDLVFGIGPIINAAGRISHAHDALEALLERDKDLRIKKVENLNLLNNERKGIDDSITRDIIEMLSSDSESVDRFTTVLYNPSWHKGVVGIAASRAIEYHYRPTIILTKSCGMITGSARSIAGFNLYKALLDCSEFLYRYGGHSFAAGLSMEEKNLDVFKARFEEVVRKTLDKSCLIEPQWIDAVISLDDIDIDLYNDFQIMSPFGPSNMQPVFCCKRVSFIGHRIVKEKHLFFSIKLRKGVVVQAVAFNMASYVSFLCFDTNLFDIVFSLELDSQSSSKDLVLRIRDIKNHDN